VQDKPDNLLEKVFDLPKQEMNSKIMQLNEAIRRTLKPGMILYLGERTNSVISELIRQFYGTKPDFTIIMHYVTEQALSLIHCGLARKIETSSCTEIIPTSGPSPIIQNAFKNKSIEIENWSMNAITQRLLAGALDIPFIPTNSIFRTTMAEENKDSFCAIHDPFGTGKRVNIVRALKPDVALIHGWAADPIGNTIVAPCIMSGDYRYGAEASKKGVIVTVEQIVSFEFIKKHAALVSIPASIVNSVSLTPFGAHPRGMVSNYGVEEFQLYSDDYEFSRERRDSFKDVRTLDSWIKTWILDCKTHEEYLEKVGSNRISRIKREAVRNNWRGNLDLDSISCKTEYNSREMMLIAAARKIRELVLQNNYNGLLCGIGTSALPVWIAYYYLRKEHYDVNLWIGSGVYGFVPLPGDPQLFNAHLINTANMLTDGLSAYGVYIGGNHRRKHMAVLSAAQVDQFGNLNSTRISTNSYLIGSGGSNDACNANEVLVVIPQSKKRLVSKVPYITCAGENIKTIVTDMGIFTRMNDKFILKTYLPYLKSISGEEAVKRIRNNCGWEFGVSPNIKEESPPCLEELLMLRAFDPEKFFI